MPDILDEQDFYELMQTYRWSGIAHGGSEADVVPAFEAVKEWIRQRYTTDGMHVGEAHA